MDTPTLGQRISFESYQGRPAGEGIIIAIFPYKAIFGKDKGKQCYNLGVIPDVKNNMYDYHISAPGDSSQNVLTEYFNYNEWEDDWDEDEAPIMMSEYVLKDEYTGYYIDSKYCTPLIREYTPEQCGDTEDDI